ncbi:DUF4097 family beta strand repeat-containing protein [Novilysobacter erysipheiresistens]|uniref:Polymer-forming cytoskeletal protein n=1 Tax=Novilysobacter erysipheiresistens TaxID=1749332 RepID=A0ABU7Z063_9GAMM
MTHCRFALAISLALLATSPAALAANDDHSKVNGTVRVDAGERAGDLDTVNGSIKVDTGAQVGDAETVNGSIRIADNVHAGGLSTVNGSIRTGRDVEIGADVGTVNGSVFVDRGGNIGGDVETVNGAIGLVDTDVAGGIETVNGDLTVGVGSHVRGGIHYEKPGQQWISFNRRDPRVIIGPNARVDGPLVFERDVELYVHESAQIGAVTGATAIRYQGDRAPTGK